MSERPAVQIKFAPTRSFTNFQENFVGCQSVAGQRGWWPELVDFPDNGAVDGRNCILTLGPYLFIVGSFTTVGGVARAGFAALDRVTGELVTTWNPALSSSPVCLGTDGQFLYVGGNFTGVGAVTTINGKAINGLVRFDIDAKLDETWNPAPNAIPIITAFEHNPKNNTMLIGSAGLTSMDGTTRNRMAEVNIAGTGTVTTFDPNVNVGGTSVLSIIYDRDLDQVYAGGLFSNIGGAARTNLARLNFPNGTADSVWAPDPDGGIQDIALDGQKVYAAGAFANIGVTSTARNRIAALDQTTAEVTPWDPDANGTVQGVEILNGIVFLGGAFTTIGGTGRNRLAAVDDTNAANLQDWDPNANGTVNGIRLVDRTIYAGGAFTTIGVSSATRLARIRFPIFTDTNTKYFDKTGDDANAGTKASPKLTAGAALGALGGAFHYAVCLDSGTYEEILSHSYTGNAAGGLYAEDGQQPTIQAPRGVDHSKLGARISGRLKFSTGAFPSTFYFVSETVGDDGTGVRGDPDLPFKTIGAALGDGSRLANDTVRIVDSSEYTEQLNAAALAVTIEAEAGQVPTLNAGGGTGIQADTGVTLNLYGLNMKGTIGGFGFLVLFDGPGEMFDCTLNGSGSIHQESTAGAVTLTVENCIFGSHFNGATLLDKTGTVAFTNCLWDQATVSVLLEAIRIDGSGGGAPTVTVDRCTFQDDDAARAAINWRGSGGSANANGSLIVTNSIFKNYAGNEFPTFAQENGTGVNLSTLSGSVLTVDNCLFENMEGPAVACKTQNATMVHVIKNCLMKQCALSLQGDPATVQDSLGAIAFVEGGNVAGGVTITNVAILGSGSNGIFHATDDEGVINANDAVIITSAKSALLWDLTSGGYQLDGVIIGFSKGNELNRAGVGGAASGFRNILRASDFADLGGQALGAHTFYTDPALISTASESENVGLNPTSIGVGNSLNDFNIGLKMPLLNITGAAQNFTLDGFKFTGPVNFQDGVHVQTGLVARVFVSYNTFDGLGPLALRLAGQGIAEFNLFEVNGIALQLADEDALARRNVGVKCGSAAILVAAPTATIENNTAYLCGFGQFDKGRATTRIQKNNVYSGSSGADYSGDLEQTNSLIVNLDPERPGTVVNGERRDPLFRNRETDDVRLQTIATGFIFDSPAKDLGDDGDDAGAFSFFYGPLVEGFTTVKFDKLAGNPGLAYRNPDRYERRRVPLKLREGDTHGGITYSDAAIFKSEHVLSWDPENDMPTAQVDDLIAIYTTGDGECQISFDGGVTFIPVRILRSNDFVFTELAGTYYGNTDIPTPIDTLVFRESI